MKSKFAIGSVVTLVSGSRKMVVRKYDQEQTDLVLCNWHTDEGDPRDGWYLESMLTLAA